MKHNASEFKTFGAGTIYSFIRVRLSFKMFTSFFMAVPDLLSCTGSSAAVECRGVGYSLGWLLVAEQGLWSGWAQ